MSARQRMSSLQRIFQSAIGWAELMSVYLGDRLGWYRSLSADGPATASELAARTGTNARYAREWLEQQAVSRFLLADDSDDAEKRRFTITDAAAEALTDERSLAYIAPVSRIFAASGAQVSALLDAYRTGGGVSWSEMGEDARQGQADMNRPWFDSSVRCFADARPPAPRAERSHRARRGCRHGRGLVVDRARPGVSEPAGGRVRRRRAIRRAGPSRTPRPRAWPTACSSTSPAVKRSSSTGPFDVAFAFECIHDMPQPGRRCCGRCGDRCPTTASS